MTFQASRVYFDTCCFVDVAQEQLGLKPDGNPDHVECCRVYLRAAMLSDVLIFTSLMTLTEFIYAKKDELDANGKRVRLLNDPVKENIRRLLLAGRPVLPVQPTPKITALSRDMCWERDLPLNLSPVDRVHLASASLMGCTHFVTTDGPLLKRSAEILKALSIRLVTCDQIKGLLPETYFPPQMDLPHIQAKSPSRKRGQTGKSGKSGKAGA